MPEMHASAFRDSVLPVVEAELVDLVEDRHELGEGLSLILLPGHTAGHMGLRIDRHDGHAVFCGDALHSPVQILQPNVSTSSCADPKLAAATRRALLEEAAETGGLLVPAHFRGRPCTRIRRGAAGFEPILEIR